MKCCKVLLISIRCVTLFTYAASGYLPGYKYFSTYPPIKKGNVLITIKIDSIYGASHKIKSLLTESKMKSTKISEVIFVGKST